MLIQHIFAESSPGIYGLVKFCWHSIFCRISWFLPRQQILHTQLSIVESSSGILITQQVFADTSYFCWISSFRWLVKFFANTTYFCWVIIRYLCGLIKFCWHSIFCRISWLLLRPQIFAYSAIFCRVIIRHFDNSASFCWHSIFLLNQLISLTWQIFADTTYFCWVITMSSQRNELIQQKIRCVSNNLVSYHMSDDDSTKDSWVSKNVVSQQKSADTAYFADTADFCWDSKFLLTQLSFVESSSAILITQQVCADTAYFSLNQLISLTCQIFCWYSTFLLSHHQVFVRTNQLLLTQHILPNQLIFAETANFCLLSYLLSSYHRAFW